MHVSYPNHQSRLITIGLAAYSLFATSSTVHAFDAKNPPSIHLTHVSVNYSARDTLKRAHKMCLLKGKYGVPVDSTQPDWSKMYIKTDDEYFQGGKYAIYKKSARYKLNRNCSIKITPNYTADIDDGTTRQIIDLVKGKSVTGKSIVVLRRNSEAELRTFAKIHPLTAGEIPEVLGIEQASQLLQSSSIGSDTISGVKCDYVMTKFSHDAKVCYWSESRVYPGIQARPIILKSVVTMGKTNNVRQAVFFEVGKPIDGAVFNPKY